MLAPYSDLFWVFSSPWYPDQRDVHAIHTYSHTHSLTHGHTITLRLLHTWSHSHSLIQYFHTHTHSHPLSDTHITSHTYIITHYHTYTYIHTHIHFFTHSHTFTYTHTLSHTFTLTQNHNTYTCLHTFSLTHIHRGHQKQESSLSRESEKLLWGQKDRRDLGIGPMGTWGLCMDLRKVPFALSFGLQGSHCGSQSSSQL